MIVPDILVRAIGAEAQPVAVIDGFHPDPDALRAAALATPFGPAERNYPGLRAPLPPDYFAAVKPALTRVLRDVFDYQGVDLIDASFSIVTRAPAGLSLAQRLPHVDSTALGRVALVHYLSPDGGDGTAFFRHRATGFETILDARAPAYFARLNAELAAAGPPPAEYIADSTAQFDRTATIEARYNRAILYRSAMLHSGAIRGDAPPDPDPARGRLTVTGFFARP